ncbi:ribosomal protein S18-alanine N-acetyltransferase [Mobilicoccus massiliensis]|uniref:ribosomal protein S18-alanine N-acetyltransferase n=1 Tax=Mobilicoccus massiliensis TaxID=1522310 RepID=UPI000B1DB961
MTVDEAGVVRAVSSGASAQVGAGARLREMAWTDIPRLVELERELFADDAWSEQSWWAELAGRPRREYVVVVDEGSGAGDDRVEDLLGYAGLDHGGEVADVMTIAVAPSGRRRGLGTLLLDALADLARARGEQHLLLEVRADNAAALALYERAGFRTLSTRRRYYPGDVDAHVMRLTLEGPRP